MLRSLRLALLTTAILAAAARADTAKIVNGLFTSDYPSVGILLRGGSPGTAGLNCSGTMIGCETFVTAAHCVENDLNPSHYFVFLQHAGLLPVASISYHPDYNFPVADVAVLKLSAPFTGIRPSVINTTMSPGSGTPATIVGFGRSGGSREDYGLKRYGAVATTACHSGISNTTSVCWDFLYPLGPAGEDSSTCNGDSGGPLFVDFGSGPRLAGITSGGAAASCLPDDLSYDANVYYYSAWIAGEAGADLASTSCGAIPQVGDTGTTVASAVGTLTSTSTSALHAFKIPAGTVRLRIALNASEENGNDFDIYVKAGSPPTTSSFDCKGDGSNQYGFCELTNPASGTWYALVKRFAGGSGAYQVTVTSFPIDCTLPANDGAACSDGNDCTGPDTCQAGACTGAALSNGTPCDDRSVCTVSDTCQAGVCSGQTPSCQLPFVSGRSTLTIRDNASSNDRDRFLWKWLAGSATTKAQFGDPTTSNDYALCVYDMGSSPELKLEHSIPASTLWSQTTTGYRYSDPERTHGGVAAILLKEGSDGAAKIVLKAKGTNLILPALPFAENGPVKVRLIGNGNCWESSYSNPTLSDSGHFKSHAD